jgi:hypothetical protein
MYIILFKFDEALMAADVKIVCSSGEILIHCQENWDCF